ncbi:MAG: hypothetical protein IJN82_04930 [Clostridia bacterium]|nr:hypothetical protein [Clostridia bacterium]
MSKKPDLTKLERWFSKGKPFNLTDAQYEAKTGAMLPKRKWYLLNRSALAKECEKHGFKMRVQEKTVYFEKEN